MSKIPALASTLVTLCKEKKVTISCAESCTGGLLAASITDIPGASAVFPGSVVSYDNKIKIQLLGVTQGTLEKHGAVSESCAAEMAIGVAKLMDTQLALSITGIAGPDGGTEEKPVGTVCFGFLCNDSRWTQSMHFKGDRTQIRLQSVEFAMQIIINRCLGLRNT